MSVPIVPISSPAAVGGIAAAIKPGAAASASDAFGSILSDAIHSVEGLRENSQQSIDKLLSGEGGELHEVALAAQKAQLGFEMFVQVRNKVVQAYQEVMRMQL
ncbi:MAG: flagellar hook-basal body complex protein FliE [Bryobacteraceae bacterium]|jgi:flagellar hook-basal body complex protein FliE